MAARGGQQAVWLSYWLLGGCTVGAIFIACGCWAWSQYSLHSLLGALDGTCNLNSAVLVQTGNTSCDTAGAHKQRHWRKIPCLVEGLEVYYDGEPVLVSTQTWVTFEEERTTCAPQQDDYECDYLVPWYDAQEGFDCNFHLKYIRDGDMFYKLDEDSGVIGRHKTKMHNASEMYFLLCITFIAIGTGDLTLVFLCACLQAGVFQPRASQTRARECASDAPLLAPTENEERALLG
eukprot:TRINITY_DN42044_c0_g1_i1.p1 TRINITY_DN42044_c0_g1~~TRINITY_DN42044_c0_g1_i1.p1  ORF type:complete len:234 (-),score=17.33 TRINITY_DN42044_c0_g1_i1:140-841(-)